MKNFIIITFILVPTLLFGQRLRTEGKYIVDSEGEEVILRSMGLGGWMLMEGYMMQSSDVADTQHEFRERLEELMGKEKTDEFFNAWLDNHVTKRDIDSLAAWGYNAIRLPMHYNLYTLPIEDEPVQDENTWLTRGFELTDQLLAWCKENEIYLILDLHAAPGGQGFNAAISDYDPSKPSLWESKENRDKTVALWTKLAERYKDEDWIGGYDLINETNWYEDDMGSNNALLRQLSAEITESIRAIGDNHIIYIEGNSWANDFNGMTPPWDDNMAYSFHKYWNNTDPGSIQWVLDIRNQHNVPLWMGEAGENSNPWFTDVISMLEEQKVGWSWWPMKRIETIVSPYSIEFTQGYKNILSYWRGDTPKPSVEQAYEWMMELALMSNSENCDYQKDTHDAMIRQPHTDETKPFTQVSIPGTLFMSNFDLGKHGFAYWDIDYANYSASAGQFSIWNRGWWYRNDAVDIEKVDNIPGGNGYHLGYVNKEEWVNYTVNVEKTGIYDVNVQFASQQAGALFHLAVDGIDVTPVIELSSTGGWTTYANKLIEDVILSAGQHTITLHIDGNNAANFSKMAFSLQSEIIDQPFQVLTANTEKTEPSLKITTNYAIDGASLTSVASDFELNIDNEKFIPVEVNYSVDEPNSLDLVFDFNLHYKDNLLISYSGSSILDTAGTVLEMFTDQEVINLLEPRWIVPRRIQAEDFSYNQGFELEPCEDTGNGFNLGYADPGDFAEYKIRVDEARDYEINFRVASQSFQGRITIYLLDGETETDLGTFTFPSTGGWQKWQTSSHKISLPEGDNTLKFRVSSGGFNLNWFEFRDIILSVEDINEPKVSVYPNPSQGRINIKNATGSKYILRNLAGKDIAAGKVKNGEILLAESIRSGNYILTILDNNGGNEQQLKIIIVK